MAMTTTITPMTAVTMLFISDPSVAARNARRSEYTPVLPSTTGRRAANRAADPAAP